MNTLDWICSRFNTDPTARLVEIPGAGRADLAALFGELGYTYGAEIGVERGLYATVLASHVSWVYAVDPWQVYEGYREHISQDKLDGFYQEVVEKSPGNVQVIRDTSANAARCFSDGLLDFVYIDANHTFEYVTNDIAAWSAKVKPGGIIAGHDYSRRKMNGYQNHVKDVVQAWTYAHGIRPLFILRGDHSPSWFWVVQ